jgi:hypothetical protein
MPLWDEQVLIKHLTRASWKKLPQMHSDTKQNRWMIFFSSGLCVLVAKIFFHKCKEITIKTLNAAADNVKNAQLY